MGWLRLAPGDCPIVRASEAETRGLVRRNVWELAAFYNHLWQPTRGLYVERDMRLPLVSFALYRTPHAIAALESALHLHDVVAEEPPAVWIAIAEHARKPCFDACPLEAIRWKHRPEFPDVIRIEVVRGLVVPVFSLARTFVDLLRLRRRVGVKKARPLAEYLSTCLATDELLDSARRCHAESVVRRFLDGKLFERDGAWNPADPFAVSP